LADRFLSASWSAAGNRDMKPAPVSPAQFLFFVLPFPFEFSFSFSAFPLGFCFRISSLMTTNPFSRARIAMTSSGCHPVVLGHEPEVYRIHCFPIGQTNLLPVLCRPVFSIVTIGIAVRGPPAARSDSQSPRTLKGEARVSNSSRNLSFVPRPKVLLNFASWALDLCYAGCQRAPEVARVDRIDFYAKQER